MSSQVAKRKAVVMPTKPYRYKGPGKHYVGIIDEETGEVDPNKAWLEEGQVVELTAAQARSFADRFDPVHTTESVAAEQTKKDGE